MQAVLNVGAGPVLVPEIHGHPNLFPDDHWRIVSLDIDPATNPDICLDARDLGSLLAAEYDAIYMSHTLEHFIRDEALEILRSFQRILKPDGMVYLRVPDIGLLNTHLAQGKTLEDVAFSSASGPITYRDIRDGYGPELARGNDWYRHKFGYDTVSMSQILTEAGFQRAEITRVIFELQVVASFVA